MLYKKTEARIRQYLTFLDKKKYSSCSDLNRVPVPPVNCSYAVCREIHRVPPSGEDLDWQPLGSFPFPWGADHESWWFKFSFTLPDDLAGRELFLEADTQTDTLVFIDGTPEGAVNPFHGKLRLPSEITERGSFEVALEAWAGHTFPGYHPDDGPRVLTTVAVRQESYPLFFREPRILVREEDINGLYYDASVLFETAVLQEEGSLLRSRICRDLHQALLKIDFTAEHTVLMEQCRTARARIAPLVQLENGSLAPRIYSVGNAHLDHAWLWPIAETSRKCARTCANMVSYLEEFPDFRFLFSQPVQMEDLKKNYPDIFKRVLSAYERGQWEPNGGMWVEADCNLSGGESLIRQFLVGRQATRELFGYTGDVLWLPDVFGYTAGMPQILKGCGIERFVTSKISWNDTTRFPYDLFRWEGIDGTTIPTHFITTAYEGRNNPAEARAAWDKLQHKDYQSSLLRSIGEGDGGGGTMRSDLEYMGRMGDLQGCPQNSWAGLSESLKAICPDPEELPLYRGELYLELHRGTYTTQGRIKRFNRKLEYLLREVELKEVRLLLGGAAGSPELLETHRAKLQEFWKSLLTLQFHDILPGSSVQQVNEEALEQMESLEQGIRSLGQDADRFKNPAGEEAGLVIGNSLPWERTTAVRVPETLIKKGVSFPCQKFILRDGTEESLGLASLKGLALVSPENALQDPRVLPGQIHRTEDRIETPFYSLKLNGKGGISSLILKDSDREMVLPGSSLNTFYTVEDLPAGWDAWDIEDDYKLKETQPGKLESLEVLSEGELFIQIRQTLAIGKASLLTQDMVIYRHSPRIDFHTAVDWQERHTLLRVDFPTTLKGRDALFDIPFGYIRRDTHENSPRNRAQFEVCAHKWAAVGDARRQAALLSDCKYGYQVREGQLSLTLLRSPEAPDPSGDRGFHEFTYSFLPLDGPDIRSVVREGWDLNIPAEIHPGYEQAPLFEFSSEDVMVESLKIGEDGCSVVLRIWEMTGADLKLSLKTNPSCGFTGWEETNLLEDSPGEKYPADNAIALDFHGFEIKTLKFYL